MQILNLKKMKTISKEKNYVKVSEIRFHISVEYINEIIISSLILHTYGSGFTELII